MAAITPQMGTAAMPAVRAASDSSESRGGQSSQLRDLLGTEGYNYTDTAIVDHSLNGIGASNPGVGTENWGGGKSVCCFGWVPATKLPLPVQIEWTRDEKTWCRQTVLFDRPGPPEPTTFEVHFFPDRHIALAIIADYSPPVLKLKATVQDYRIGRDVRKEKEEGMRKDSVGAECSQGRFPIGTGSELRGEAPNAKP